MDVLNFHNLAKHKRYLESYKPNEEYWGIGIENETYIEAEKWITKPADFMNNQKRERYSVDYWKIYDENKFKKVTKKCIDDIKGKRFFGKMKRPDATIQLPLLLNSHSFTDTDRFGQPLTTYEVNPKPNPKYSGTTIFDNIMTSIKYGDFFRNGYEKWFCFDGDTIEFITQNFRCAKVKGVIEELITHKNQWITNFSNVMDDIDKENILDGVFKYPKENHGLAIYHTNRNNIAIFNNGTYHINITLPTELDENCNIKDWNLFVDSHRKVARLFQWVTPFLIARFGSGDIFSRLDNTSFKNMFPNGSQRLCVSRYVGAAIYDTKNMPIGKILTIPNESIPGRWYEKIHNSSNCIYKTLSVIGVDINFHKHKNHGLEFRIFDWFPEEQLEECINLLVWMCDEALNKELTDDPRLSDIFNDILAKSIWDGKLTVLDKSQLSCFSEICGLSSNLINDITSNITLIDMYNIIKNTWNQKWHEKGEISKKMI